MTSMVMLALDALLIASLLGLAIATLSAADTRHSVVLFIAFGLVLAVVWGRLLAPDVALAEAAIGAGLTGALLLAALHEQTRHVSAGPDGASKDSHPGLRLSLEWLVTLFSLGIAALLAWSLTLAFERGPQDALAQAIGDRLAVSGVSNPVTAVLLNFRAYDTLLELAVLLTAVLGILMLGPARAGYRPAGTVYAGLTRWLIPVLVLTGGYLLWTGAHAPGGAFQAGATLAAAGVVLRLAGQPVAGLNRNGRALRVVIAAGAGVFLLVGVGLLLLGRPFLGYPPALAGSLILLIETAAMLAIAATLALAFIGGRPQPAKPVMAVSEEHNTTAQQVQSHAAHADATSGDQAVDRRASC